MMRLFQALKRAIRCGDAVAIETAYNDFLPYFEAAGNSNYVEIVLNQTDQYYKILSKRELHLLRCNRTARLYGGKSKCGIPFAEWPLDGVIELIQRYLHQMNFTPNIAGYKKHSASVMFYYRSLLFAMSEYY